MPLERQNYLGLAEVMAPEASGHTLDELLVPACRRPGELSEPTTLDLPASLKVAAREAGIPASLALTVVAERSLVTREMGAEAAELVALLDARARLPCRLRLSAASADYARVLVAALNGRSEASRQDDTVLVVPTRLADRLRAVPGLSLPVESLRDALSWELAAVRAGRTMTEWALGEALAAGYPVSAARQVVAAASAVR